MEKDLIGCQVLLPEMAYRRMEVSMNFQVLMEWQKELLPLLRVAWTGAIGVGIVLVVVAFILKRNPSRKISPWVAGGFGALLIVSPGVQLIASLL